MQKSMNNAFCGRQGIPEWVSLPDLLFSGLLAPENIVFLSHETKKTAQTICYEEIAAQFSD